MKKTAGQFAHEYAARSGVSVEWLKDAGRIVQPCDCADDICEGWQMGHAEGFGIFFSPICGRCLSQISGEFRSTGHRAVCLSCWDEMERTKQAVSGGTLPVVIKTNYDETCYCGACGMKLQRYGANFCHACGERVARWNHSTHDVIVVEGWNHENKVEMVDERWRGRLDLSKYHPVRLKNTGWDTSVEVSAPTPAGLVPSVWSEPFTARPEVTQP